MVIKETSVFTKIITELMPDDVYAALQEELVKRPNLGDLMPNSGGLRKIRWKLPNRGKRGGVRIIYYWVADEDQILMIYAYSKVNKENLTKTQLKQLKFIVEEEIKNG